jgi:serine/threonine protein kinase
LCFIERSNKRRERKQAMALSEGTVLRQGRYRIVKLLAYGGFGFTYLAFDRLAERQVVLKELIPVLADDSQAVRRFVREGRAMQRLRHPNIARTEATFQDRGNHYMVVEYVRGAALSDWTESEKKMSLNRAGTIVLTLCDAVSYLHGKGVIHCDLNPSNVLLDASGQPKLVDLGIAHIADVFVHRSWRTEQSFAMGTVLCMAPEQLDGVRTDPRVDLYALGAMLYQVLAGRPYLDFDLRHTPSAQADNIQRVRTERPAPIPGVPTEVMEVILRSLAKDPDERYPDVATFQRELVRALVPHVPTRKGMELLDTRASSPRVSSTRASVDGQAGANLETIQWPSWIWGALLAVNLAVMVLVGLLLMRSP